MRDTPFTLTLASYLSSFRNIQSVIDIYQMCGDLKTRLKLRMNLVILQYGPVVRTGVKRDDV